MHNVYQIKNVCKTYPNGHKALNNVSININQGEVIGLIGVNGSGKTTLSSIIASLIPLTSGEVLYNGKSIYDNISKHRQMIGLCPQKINLDNRITVKENLINDALFFGLSRKEAVERFNVISKKLMLQEYENSYPATLSGGYKQRVSIGRSLMHDPKLVIFDEPTLGLDPHIRKHLWDIILDLKKDGVSVILTTHYMDEVEYLSDYICLLHNGEVKFSGTLDELKKERNGNLEDIMVAISEEEA
ncbi:ABC transporter ATP-binding protein [Candidatus Cytomitobacter primus]|uniref:ABC transporter ATP-binding protein n=1 Tax=Candidatus Cytomitobacter primus TaxID=2066024 RepID=A0A5C0UE82_9PROT|nr:ABC transporter ATP-binding protein [Candidatus Cytomitobacter primus]QEK38396.1 ABC transporter ATP-binding protein [Candidatus Cytomitobacter primus]